MLKVIDTCDAIDCAILALMILNDKGKITTHLLGDTMNLLFDKFTDREISMKIFDKDYSI
jgi:hypothetical protein